MHSRPVWFLCLCCNDSHPGVSMTLEHVVVQLKHEKQRVVSIQLDLARAKEQNFLVVHPCLLSLPTFRPTTLKRVHMLNVEATA